MVEKLAKASMKTHHTQTMMPAKECWPMKWRLARTIASRRLMAGMRRLKGTLSRRTPNTTRERKLNTPPSPPVTETSWGQECVEEGDMLLHDVTLELSRGNGQLAVVTGNIGVTVR